MESLKIGFQRRVRSRKNWCFLTIILNCKLHFELDWGLKVPGPTEGSVQVWTRWFLFGEDLTVQNAYHSHPPKGLLFSKLIKKVTQVIIILNFTTPNPRFTQSVKLEICYCEICGFFKILFLTRCRPDPDKLPNSIPQTSWWDCSNSQKESCLFHRLKQIRGIQIILHLLSVRWIRVFLLPNHYNQSFKKQKRSCDTLSTPIPPPLPVCDCIIFE